MKDDKDAQSMQAGIWSSRLQIAKVLECTVSSNAKLGLATSDSRITTVLDNLTNAESCFAGGTVL